MNRLRVVSEIKKVIRKDSAHDFWHTLRVAGLAEKIAEIEGGNKELLFLIAMLHDVVDWKFVGSEKNEKANWGGRLTALGLEKKLAIQALDEAVKISFGKGTVPDTIEGKIVQDADRLDAIGAIGIARVFAYGGKLDREIHNPNASTRKKLTPEKYRKKQSETSLVHFNEKLLKLKDMMNTETAKKMAYKRHIFMKSFLSEFFKEWEESF